MLPDVSTESECQNRIESVFNVPLLLLLMTLVVHIEKLVWCMCIFVTNVPFLSVDARYEMMYFGFVRSSC